MSDKKDLLENCLSLFELNRIDRDIYTWTGKNVGGQEFLEGRLWPKH